LRSKPHSLQWPGAILLVALAGTLPSQSVNAKYVKADLISIPVERLINNLEALAKDNPRDAELRLNLARVHAMAYALKTDTAEVRKGRENEGVWFGYNPTHVPFEVKPNDDKDRVKAARVHLEKAIEHYKGVLNLEPGNLTAALGYAWCIEQSGNKQGAIKEYRKVIEAAWKKESDLKRAPLGWHSVTAEAAGYLIPLLDKQKARQEIVTLQSRIEQMGQVRRPITPLVIPLRDDRALTQLEDRSASVGFDADGTGLKKRWSWITKDAGWLVYDPQGEGKITSALRMFGSVTFWLFWENGYHALAAMDDDHDGRLTGNELQGLAIWQDVNCNGACERGEVRPLADWGIVELSCHYARNDAHPEPIAHSPRGVFFRDGSNRPTYDLLLRPATNTVE
jgi:tetratricopeptide (TPR) repeat protein